MDDFCDFFSGVFLEELEANMEPWNAFPFLNSSGQRAVAHEQTAERKRGWIFYVAQDDRYYYGMAVIAPDSVVELNSGFYDGVAQTFQGRQPK